MIDLDCSPLLISHLIEGKAPLIVLKMLCKYHQHSVLHQIVLYFIRLCLRVGDLRNALFKQFGIIEFVIVKATEEWSKPMPERKSYSGILHSIASSIEKMQFHPSVKTILDSHKAWKSFCETLYATYLEENTKYTL